MQSTIDAKNKTIGRLATEISVLLRGKNMPSYRPNILPNIIVKVKNVNNMKISEAKLDNKLYHHYSGYPGGIRTRSLRELMTADPKKVLVKAVYSMLPKNRTRDKIINNLKFEK